MNVGFLTSGGEAPGMNACIRGIVRCLNSQKINSFAIQRGFQGMIEGEIKKITSMDVDNTIHKGGSIIKTSRSEAFCDFKKRKIAYDNLKKNNIDALIIIGGDGTFNAANIIANETDFHVVAVPATIYNDISGTTYTIGFDTALNTAVNLIDRIRDVAISNDKIFIVEVGGLKSGELALHVGYAVGADEVLIPETLTKLDVLTKKIFNERAKGNGNMIFVVAEGDEAGGAFKVAEQLKNNGNIDANVCVLGEIQRGGPPSAYDRITASSIGIAAAKAVKIDKNVYIRLINDNISYDNLENSVKNGHLINMDTYKKMKMINK